jgi:hypothetical protein
LPGSLYRTVRQNLQNDFQAISAFLVVLRTQFINLSRTQDPRSRFFYGFDVFFRLFQKQIFSNYMPNRAGKWSSLFLISLFLVIRSVQAETVFRFDDFQSGEAATDVLKNVLQPGATISDIRRVMQEAGASCYDAVGSTLTCRYEKASSVIGLMWTIWVAEFALDEQGTLKGIRMTRGFRGP